MRAGDFISLISWICNTPRLLITRSDSSEVMSTQLKDQLDSWPRPTYRKQTVDGLDLINNLQEGDREQCGRITSRNGQKYHIMTVSEWHKIENDGDPWQPTCWLQMAHNDDDDDDDDEEHSLSSSKQFKRYLQELISGRTPPYDYGNLNSNTELCRRPGRYSAGYCYYFYKLSLVHIWV